MSFYLCPYLMFEAESKAALEFYQSILGGELFMDTYGESKMSDDPVLKDRIIHGMLKTPELTLMASDSHPDHGGAPEVGNNVHLTLVGEDKDRLTKIFESLAEDGEIVMPLEPQFWGDVYGTLVDKFGIHWDINISKPQE